MPICKIGVALVRFPHFSKILPKVLHVDLVCCLHCPKVLHVVLVRFSHFSKMLPKVLHVALVNYVTFAKRRTPICKIDVFNKSCAPKLPFKKTVSRSNCSKKLCSETVVQANNVPKSCSNYLCVKTSEKTMFRKSFPKNRCRETPVQQTMSRNVQNIGAPGFLFKKKRVPKLLFKKTVPRNACSKNSCPGAPVQKKCPETPVQETGVPELLL